MFGHQQPAAVRQNFLGFSKLSSPITIEPTSIDGVYLIGTRWLADERGSFSEVYNTKTFAEAGIKNNFIQENHVRNSKSGVLRGLHFQRPPVAQAKLVRVVVGAIFDIVVDIRRGSPSYGEWMAVTLSAEDGRQLFIPPGFAHGYCTLTYNSEVSYLVDAPYDPASEGGIAWNDPMLAIPWPFGETSLVISKRDTELSSLEALDSPFIF